MTFLEGIASYLQTASSSWAEQYKIVQGKNLFIGKIPAEAPAAVIGLNIYLGQPPVFTMGPYISSMEKPRVQISVRAEPEQYSDGQAWTKMIRNVIAGAPLPDATHFNGVFRIETTDTGNYLGPDSEDRPKFTLNFTFWLNMGSDGYPLV
jgi:hypothetical protein